MSTFAACLLQFDWWFVDPLGQPTVTAGSDNYFPTCYLSVRPYFSNLAKAKQQKTMIATGETVGLAEWIIDDTCLVTNIFMRIRRGSHLYTLK